MEYEGDNNVDNQTARTDEKHWQTVDFNLFRKGSMVGLENDPACDKPQRERVCEGCQDLGALVTKGPFDRRFLVGNPHSHHSHYDGSSVS